ncbi:hypothetical protein GQ44DRAFT_507479 [Phaeosphaeriaceae sp. PMI808]|nr:hypothetical protein GQ44DRAFT_507479 [Phaeosphaeriaceae sp. PMI808]
MAHSIIRVLLFSATMPSHNFCTIYSLRTKSIMQSTTQIDMEPTCTEMRTPMTPHIHIPHIPHIYTYKSTYKHLHSEARSAGAAESNTSCNSYIDMVAKSETGSSQIGVGPSTFLPGEGSLMLPEGETFFYVSPQRTTWISDLDFVPPILLTHLTRDCGRFQAINTLS